MPAETFQAAGEEFQFYFYNGGLNGRPVVAAKIKCYLGVPKLRPGYEDKLKQLRDYAPKLPVQIEEWAWGSGVEGWWDWARARARELNLGELESMGRSGGWLGISKYTRDYVRNLCHSVSLECGDCGLPYSEHANGKCLFDHSAYIPDPETMNLLRNLKEFVEECEKSVTGATAVERYTEELEALIDSQWEEMRSAQRR